ncbi:MAG: putative sulfate/molybdate transporter [Deltaproteobacteria bacterium]|jgi:SulP family sulfate permease|nr:putative sulfate/molybdate transporter [Deltaproteobacteria bacterium]
MRQGYKFNRLELAGSFGDLGTLLPLAMGMILINGLKPTGLFLTLGLFYVIAGMYFDITVPVQPMKVISAYAIATAMDASQITAAGYLMGFVLLLIGITGAVTVIGKSIPKSVVRGVQLSTGILLMVQGVKLMLGTSTLQKIHQAVEPYLLVQSVGPIPIGIIIGIAGTFLTLLLLANKRFPAGLIVVGAGLSLGLIFGKHADLNPLRVGINLPPFLPFGWPTQADFTFALFALVLPQMPMTVGNAVIAYTDLSESYFKEQSNKVTYRSATISMALANFLSSTFGGMPLCHGAGGLAAHYRFGARTAGSNIMIGGIFIILAVLLGDRSLAIINLLPLAVLGILLLFAGGELCLTILDLTTRKDLFVSLVILGITLATNLAAGFIVGIAVAYLLKYEKLSV